MDGEKKRPELLDTLAFAALDGKALIGRLAHLYIKAEPSIKAELGKRARNNYQCDDKTVAKWMRPVYTPPFGKVREMVAAVTAEVHRQKEIIVKRGAVRAYAVTYAKKGDKTTRRNDVASLLYQFVSKDWNEREFTVKRAAVGIMAKVGEHLVIYDCGHYRGTWLFTLNRRTGVSKLVKLADNYSLEGKDLPGLLFKMAPPEVRVAAFSGIPVVADFDKLAFVVGEGPKIVPFSLEGEPVITTGFTPPVYKIER